jgi:hypothetical protein
MSTEPSKVPEWIWKKWYYSAGIRLPKKTKPWDHEKKHSRKPVWNPINPAASRLSVIHGAKVPPKLERLRTGDFRYWRGNPDVGFSHWSSCRVCRAITINHDERRAHMKEGCARFLEVTMKRLKRVNMCVICGDDTTKKSWGVPLCNKECEYEWCYVATQPTFFAELLIEVRETLRERDAIQHAY